MGGTTTFSTSKHSLCQNPPLFLKAYNFFPSFYHNFFDLLRWARKQLCDKKPRFPGKVGIITFPYVSASPFE